MRLVDFLLRLDSLESVDLGIRRESNISFLLERTEDINFMCRAVRRLISYVCWLECICDVGIVCRLLSVSL